MTTFVRNNTAIDPLRVLTGIKISVWWFVEEGLNKQDYSVVLFYQGFSNVLSNTPVSTYDVITSLCGYSFVLETGNVFIYVNVGTDGA